MSDDFCYSVNHELKEIFCRPTARCFKGITILTAIYSLVCLLICGIIGPLIKVHDGTTINSPDIGCDGCPTGPTAAEIKVRVHTLTICTLWIAAVMAVISILSFILFFSLGKRDQKKMEAT